MFSAKKLLLMLTKLPLGSHSPLPEPKKILPEPKKILLEPKKILPEQKRMPPMQKRELPEQKKILLPNMWKNILQLLMKVPSLHKPYLMWNLKRPKRICPEKFSKFLAI